MKKKTEAKTKHAKHATKNYAHKRVMFTVLAVVIVLLVAALLYYNSTRLLTDAEVKDAAYSDEVAAELEKRDSTIGGVSERTEELPAKMFAGLPDFPKDFYQVRSLIRSGRLTDYANLEEEYWQQPEFFPHFEDIGIPLLANPPKDRWGAFGIASFPADSVGAIRQGETLDMYFFIKSNYLVETYQGVHLVPVFNEITEIESGFAMPDGSRSIKQDTKIAREHISVSVDPNPFVLYPNFPKYHVNGTKKVKVTISVSENTPPGNYVIGLDTSEVPYEDEQRWLREFLNLYTSGGMTKIDRPYFQAFVEVIGGEN